jgi:hypothetical protein
VALTLIAVKLFEGEEADQNAAILLEAYKAKPPLRRHTTSRRRRPQRLRRPTISARRSLRTRIWNKTDQTRTHPPQPTPNEHMSTTVPRRVDETGEYVQRTHRMYPNWTKRSRRSSRRPMKRRYRHPRDSQYEVELPIIGKWSYKLLKISICR